MSERRDCSVIASDRKMIRYRSCRPPETELRMKLRDPANESRCFGYRRLFILLRQEGERPGINRIYRLYRDKGLAVRKRRSRRRAVGIRAPILVEAKANARWSLDFIQTMLREWGYALPYTSSRSRNSDLPRWLSFYNHKRPHGSLANKPPSSRLHAST